MSATIALLVGVSALVGTALATWRVRHPAVLAFVFMMTGWFVGELAVFHLILQAMVVALLVWAGALDDPIGQLGLAFLVLSIVGLVAIQRRAGTAAAAFERGLQAGLGDNYRNTIAAADPASIEPPPRGQAWRPFRFDHHGVEVIRNISYAAHPKRNLLDIYRAADAPRSPEGAPVVLYIHGGGWIIGDKEQQGKPMLLHLARRGYVCVSINYRLGRRDRWPAQIIDVKRAISWIREHIDDYGGNPDFIAVAGSSAGGHLASLAALTPGDPAFQPGFEHADTSIDACIPIYAPFDLTDRSGRRGRASMRRFLEWAVMSSTLDSDVEGWRAASPVWRVNADAPAMFVIQGEIDELVGREEAGDFVAALRECSTAPLVFVEVPGAQHAFEVFNSVRSREAVDAIARFLAAVVVARRASA